MAEVAGLAIGALAVTDLAVRSFGVAILSRNREIKLLQLELETQRIILEQSIRVLLHQTLPEPEINELFSDPTRLQWQNKRVDAALRNSLGDDGHRLFLSVLYDLLMIASHLEQSLRTSINQDASGNRLRAALRWALRDREKSHQALRVVNEGLKDLSAIISLRVQLNLPRANQAVQNIGATLEEVYEIGQVFQRAEDLTADTTRPILDIDGDNQSIYTVETEVSKHTYLSLAASTDVPNQA
jgi:hypothetical protein